MANVYIDEYPIDIGIISNNYISSIVYVNNEYYVLQYKNIYKLDFITGHFDIIKTTEKFIASNAIAYDNKIYYLTINSEVESSKQFLSCYDIETGTEISTEMPNSNSAAIKVYYSNVAFSTLSLKDNKIFINTYGYWAFNRSRYLYNEFDLSSKTFNLIGGGQVYDFQWITVSPVKFINNPEFDYGSIAYSREGTEYQDKGNYFGGYIHFPTEVKTIIDRGNSPYLSYHSTIKEYDGIYMINGGHFSTENGGIYYFSSISAEPKKVLDLDATYINGYVEQISEGQYVLLGTEKVAIIHIEPYKNIYTIKDEKGKETYAELNQAPNMNKALLSLVGNEKALKLTGINTENYSIKWTSFTPADKVFVGLSPAPNSSAPLIPVGKEVSVSFNDSTTLYEVYGKYRPLSTKFEIHTYKSSAEQNRVDKTNFLTADMIISGVLREASSLIHPSITFTSDIIPTFNYVYIPIFNRYYYVTDITSIKNKLWQMSLTVDVLMTYKEALLACTGYIDRNENEYNGLIPDSMISLEKGETIETAFVTNELFEDAGGTYVLQGLLVDAGPEIPTSSGPHTGESGDEHGGGGGNFGN